jgi:hypothetical protein
LDVGGLPGPVSTFGTGDRHTCAVVSGGSLFCWGDNTRGQLGDGTTMQRSSPHGVCADYTCSSPIYGVTQVTGGDVHTCARLAHGAAFCWGNNAYGQLGDGFTTDRSTPTEVQALTPAVAAVSAGDGHSCALTVAGAVRCWGNNAYGQLGDGTAGNRAVPGNVLGLGGKIPGDVNCDGLLNSIDAALVLQFSAGLLITLPCFPAADLNLDGVVNPIDAAIILQIDAGLIGSIL